jgi:hypothetical protein
LTGSIFPYQTVSCENKIQPLADPNFTEQGKNREEEEGGVRCDHTPPQRKGKQKIRKEKKRLKPPSRPKLAGEEIEATKPRPPFRRLLLPPGFAERRGASAHFDPDL